MKTTKQALRNGIATNTQADNYQLFKIALKKICEEADGNKSSPFYNTRYVKVAFFHFLPEFKNKCNLLYLTLLLSEYDTSVVELEERMGYGFALRHTLYHEVVTPYVCVSKSLRKLYCHVYYILTCCIKS